PRRLPRLSFAAAHRSLRADHARGRHLAHVHGQHRTSRSLLSRACDRSFRQPVRRITGGTGEAMSRRIAAAWLVLLLVPVAIAAQEPGNPRDARLRRDLGEALMRLRDAELRTVSAVQGSDNDPAALERGRPEFTEHAEALAHTRALLDTVVFGTTWGASELERLRAAYPRSALLDRYAAALLLRQGHADEAAAAYAALVARTNVDAALHHEHGRALERSGSRTGALTAHERALEL